MRRKRKKRRRKRKKKRKKNKGRHWSVCYLVSQSAGYLVN
jgi:hypothetical protein